MENKRAPIKKTYDIDVDTYISSAPKETQKLLLQIRKTIRSLAPLAVESISYGMPGYKLNGKPLMYYAFFKNHVSIFAASGTFFKKYTKELENYQTSKGTVRFPLDKPLPMTLIKRMVKDKMQIIKNIRFKD